jgi:hypothetical protein
LLIYRKANKGFFEKFFHVEDRLFYAFSHVTACITVSEFK